MFADTRLTDGRNTLTDKMPKIFVATIRGFTSDRKSNLRKISEGSIAVGFTGSSSVAFATFAVLQNYLMSMIVPIGRTVPTMEQIANFTSKLLEENFRDFGSVWRQPPICGLLLVGGTSAEREISAFYIEATLGTEGPKCVVSKHEFSKDQLMATGSGADRFREIIRLGNHAAVFDAVLAQVNENKPDVGGGVQAASVSVGSVMLPQVLVPRPGGGRYDVDAFFIGRTHPHFTTLGDCLLGSNRAIGPYPK